MNSRLLMSPPLIEHACRFSQAGGADRAHDLNMDKDQCPFGVISDGLTVASDFPSSLES